MRALPAFLCLALLGTTACGGASGGAEQDRTLTVLAAASLTETFTELGQRFEADHPGVDVRLAFDSSATLAAQVVEGAPADVLATADATTMQSVVDAGATTADPRVFATNHLVLVTPVGNPAGVQALADLDDPSVSYVVCVQTAPCGVLAADLLTGEGVSAEPVSREVDVKAVLSKVTLDEADAGLVYASDAVAAGEDVERIDVPAAEADRTEYLVAPVEQAGEPDLAADWVDLLLSPEGRQVLRDAGFTGPAG